MRLGTQGSTDKLIYRSGREAPVGLRFYLSVRIPFTTWRFRRYERVLDTLHP
jgi:hypothetical protein